MRVVIKITPGAAMVSSWAVRVAASVKALTHVNLCFIRGFGFWLVKFSDRLELLVTCED